MSENFVPFYLETQEYCERIDDLGAWKDAVDFHAKKWSLADGEAIVGLLKATKIRSWVDRIPRFNIDPVHPRHTLLLRDWAIQQGMDIAEVPQEI